MFFWSPGGRQILFHAYSLNDALVGLQHSFAKNAVEPLLLMAAVAAAALSHKAMVVLSPAGAPCLRNAAKLIGIRYRPSVEPPATSAWT